MTGDNVMGNRLFYSTDPDSSFVDVKFQKKKKFEEKVMIWMAILSKGVSKVYVHQSKQAIRQGTYINQCIKKRQIPFIKQFHQDENYLFWPDLANAHYGNTTEEILQKNNIPYVSRQKNPPNVPQAQARPIEIVWTLLERNVLEDNWEAKNLACLIRRVKQNTKELDQKLLQHMIEGVRRKPRAMWRDRLYSVL